MESAEVTSTLVETTGATPVSEEITDSTPAPAKALSKRAQKRAARDAEWEAKKEQRKEWTKEKRKQVKELRREKIEQGLVPKKPRRPAHQNPCNISIIIDCQFETKMTPKEIKSTARQLSHCYSANKHSPTPYNLHFTSFAPSSAIRASLAAQIKEYERWGDKRCPLTMHEGNFVDVELEGGKDSLVYLTADSENVIEELESGKTYVLGGIVDKNRYKKLCYNIAHEAGIQTARLPLGEYLEMQTRKVLTINHVFEIMVKYLETKDWRQSFLEIIPQRKGAKVKDDEGDEDDESGGENGEEEAKQDMSLEEAGVGRSGKVDSGLGDNSVGSLDSNKRKTPEKAGQGEESLETETKRIKAD